MHYYYCYFFSATDLLLAWNPICLGLVEGVIGKVQLHTGMWHFILYCFIYTAQFVLKALIL